MEKEKTLELCRYYVSPSLPLGVPFCDCDKDNAFPLNNHLVENFCTQNGGRQCTRVIKDINVATDAADMAVAQKRLEKDRCPHCYAFKEGKEYWCKRDKGNEFIISTQTLLSHCSSAAHNICNIQGFHMIEVTDITDYSKGLKMDNGKRDWSLLPWEEVEEVVKVLEFGAKKYAPDNWKKLDNLKARYRNSLMRHAIAYVSGEEKDMETSLSHMAHAACNCLFLLWAERNLK